MNCSLLVYESPFSSEAKKVLDKLSNSDMCTQERSAVNPEYIRRLFEKMRRETKKRKYVLIISLQKKASVGAFGVLHQAEVFYRMNEKALSEGMVLDLVCAEGCSGSLVINQARRYIKQQGKRFIFLEALETNKTYYIKKHGAFSIDSPTLLKMTLSLCKNAGPKSEQDVSDALDTFAMRHERTVYPLIIDARNDPGTCVVDVYTPLLKPRVCSGTTRDGRRCSKPCVDRYTRCYLHVNKP